ncbi:MAG TPA: VWA domain-containing protein [Deltaproteobacteria bacterium]|nr:VWA domain-containing protein [Deltaproteobacteria bacterium]
MRRSTMVLGLGLALGLAGCDAVSQLLATLADLDLLGIIPAEGFSDPASEDYGKVKLALGASDDQQIPVTPPGDLIEVVPDDGQEVEEGDWEEVPGHAEGSFVLLVDGSASMEATDQCLGCPTDPGRLRVEAAKALAEELARCGDTQWRMALMEFGSNGTSPGMEDTQLLSEWTTDPAEVSSAADTLGSYEGTPLWDGTYEALVALDGDAATSFSEKDPTEIGRGIVVMSDGADTTSDRLPTVVVELALEMQIPVNTIGFGPASDVGDEIDASAVDDLRRLASETGGYYGYVDSVDDLPALAKAIASAQCGGHTELFATFSEPAASGEEVRGEIRLKDSPLGVPFGFRAP